MKKDIKATVKYVRISPKKLRDVARGVQGLSAEDALETLRFIPRKGAAILYKALKSAVANAENNHGVSVKGLPAVFQVDQGPKIKRWRPVARGTAHPYARGTSHVVAIIKALN